MKSANYIGDGIYLVDLHTYGIPQLGAGYIIVDDRITVIETGPTPSVPYLLAGLRSLSIDPEDVDYLAVTHIHLDHSGGVGRLLQIMPKARVLVCEKGMPHLADPSRLHESAKRIYKDQLETLFGDIIPVPQDRIIPLKDGNTVNIGKSRKLTAYYTPGHAGHHVAYHDDKTNGLFCGEVVGLYFPVLGIISPSTPPPSFDFAAMQESTKKILALQPDVLYFSHFGPCNEVERCCLENITKINQWIEIIKKCENEGLDKEKTIAQVAEYALEELAGLALRRAVGTDTDDKYMEFITGFMRNRMKRACAPGLMMYLAKNKPAT